MKQTREIFDIVQLGRNL